jgi:hypothetical protein
MAPINTATENRTRASLNCATQEPTKGEIEFAMSLAPIENAIMAEIAKPATTRLSIYSTMNCIAI